MRFFTRAVLALPLLALAACGGDDDGDGGQPPTLTQPASGTAPVSPPPDVDPIVLEEVVSGLVRPVDIAHAGDDRLFVVEKEGAVRVVSDGSLDPEPFLDMRDQVTTEWNEQGLLGVAFHPAFPEDPRLFVYYTAIEDGAKTLASVEFSPDAGRADVETLEPLIALPSPHDDHNGGMLTFDPDGYLRLSIGDGGGYTGEDTSQDTSSLLGTIVRLDIDGGEPYAIPPDNPFVDDPEVMDEIWAYGLRNPWRFSFDRETGDLWIGDVGEEEVEEINYEPAEAGGGQNYGWRIMEGSICNADDCAGGDFTLPIFEYGRDGGCAVTGGYVYRGSSMPYLDGHYLFTDYCSGELRSLVLDGATVHHEQIAQVEGGSVTTFGEDVDGELYLVTDGETSLYRLAPNPEYAAATE